MTASLQGSVNIQTKSIKTALDRINELHDKLKSLDSVTKALEKTQGRRAKSEQDTAAATKRSTSAQQAQEKVMMKNLTLLERAANTRANYSQKIQQSNRSEQEQASLLARVNNAFTQYSAAVKRAEGDSVKLANAKAQLATATGSVDRTLKQQNTTQQNTQKSAVATERALGQLNAQYQRAVSAVNNSALSDTEKAAALNRLQREYGQTQASLRKYQAGTVNAVKAQNTFRNSTTQTQEAVRKANREFRGKEITSFNSKFRDLTGSVQVALGPLSGVASRMTALAGLFNRNAASIAAVLATTTGFTVALSRTLTVGKEAERQILSLDAQINALGLSTQVTSAELNEMAHRIAASTLTSAQAVREAQQSLLSFRNIGVDSFEDTLLAAQGLSVAFGGSLQSNLQRLGRLLDDPISNFDALNRRGITFNKQERERITLLQETGRITEAQNVVMKRFEGIMEGATGATGGLAGSLDTLAGNADITFEKLYKMGGAGDLAAEAVSGLADRVLAFSESDEAVKLANAFAAAVRKLTIAGEFLVDNLGAISTGIAALAGSALAKGIISITALTARTVGATGALTLFGDVITRASAKNVAAANSFRILGGAVTTSHAATKASTAALIPYSKAATAASVTSKTAAGSVTLLSRAVNGFKAALGPIALVIQAAFAVGSIYLFNDAMSETTSEVSRLDDAINRLGSESSLLESQMDSTAKAFFSDELKELRENQKVLSNTTRAFRDTETVVGSLEGKLSDASDRVSELASSGANANLATFQRLNPSAGLEEFEKAKQQFAEAKKEMNNYSAQLQKAKNRSSQLATEQENLLESGEQLRSTIKNGVKNLSEEEKKRLDVRNAINEQLSSSQELTTSENQRVEKAKANIKNLENQLEVAKQTKGISEEQVKALEQEIVAANKYLTVQRESTKAAREQAAQNRMSAEMLSELSAMQARANIYTQATTKSDLEARLAAAEREKEIRKNVSAISDMTTQTKLATAAKLGINTAGMTEAQVVSELTSKYREQAQALSNAQKSAQGLFNLRQKASELSSDSDSIQGIKAQFDEKGQGVDAAYQKAMIDSTLTDAQREEAVSLYVKSMTELEKQKQTALNEAMQSAEEASQLSPISDLEKLKQDYDERRQVIIDKLGQERAEHEGFLADLKADYNNAKFMTSFANHATAATDVLGGAMSAMSSLGKQQTKEYQQMALVQAAISQSLAVAQAWDDPEVPTWAKIGTAAMAGAQVAAQIKQIKSQSFATGGYVSGAGTGTSDSIQARLSDGEYVVNAAATRMLGKDYLDQLNSGRVPRMNTGGSVGRVPSVQSSGSNQGWGDLSVQVINEGNGQMEATRTEQGYDENGQMQMRVFVRQVVQEEMDAGRMDGSMARNFGTTRKPTRR